MSHRLDTIGIIFDMDGVLVDSYHAHMRSWQLLGHELRRPVTEAEFAGTFGQTSRDIIRRLFGAARSDEEVRLLDDRKEALYRDLIREQVPQMPGAAVALERLRTAGARLAVGSSGPPENVQLVIDSFAPFRFNAVVTGADVQRGKPDPQVFLLAAERLGRSPASCIVVEDAAVGIEAARCAGMRSIGFASPAATHRPSGCDWLVHSLAELTPVAIRELAVGIG